MSYRVRLDPAARKALGGLPIKVRQQILDHLVALADDPRPPQSEPLHGKLKGLRKLRVRRYRIAYQVNDDEQTVTVWEIGHRSKAYQDLERRLI